MMMARSSSSQQVVRVKREKLAACMTCPICNKLLNDATTISECLHSFCRKCIYDKITDDEVDFCPVCNIDLGCTPLEKLRADHNLEDLRAKVFPLSRSKAALDDVAPPIPLPARRKERSLSSLVVSTPRVSSQTGLTGKRTKSAGRKVLGSKDSTLPLEELCKKEEDHPESPGSPETLNKLTQSRRQNPAPVSESCKQSIPQKGTEDTAETWEGKADLWTPLNFLVEAASRTKSSKSNSQGSGPSTARDNSEPVQKPKVRERTRRIKAKDDENGLHPDFPGQVKPRKPTGARQRKPTATEKSLNMSAQALVDSPTMRHERRVGPVWLSLVASEYQEGNAPLPQISSHFLRIMDSNLPVSYIKKYLAKKLDLQSEAEVEITLQGQPVLSTVQLHNIVNWWSQTMAKPERVQTCVGSSAKDFVMVLTYGRRAQLP